MSETTFMGVERSRIDWKPTIDYTTCDYCMECVKFCPHQVFEVRESEEIKLIVRNPDNCVVFCRACSKMCCFDALSFPDKNATMQRIKDTRDEMESQDSELTNDLRLQDNENALVEIILNDLNKADDKAIQTSDEPNLSVHFEYETFQHGKFIFRVPKNREMYFNENDCWAFVVGNKARIGVTDFVQQNLSDILYFTPPEIGAEIEQFGEAGDIESSKSVFELISPVSGRVTSINEILVQKPELINENPYELGWFAEIELSDFGSDKELLINFDKYFEFMKKKVEDLNG